MEEGFHAHIRILAIAWSFSESKKFYLSLSSWIAKQFNVWPSKKEITREKSYPSRKELKNYFQSN